MPEPPVLSKERVASEARAERLTLASSALLALGLLGLLVALAARSERLVIIEQAPGQWQVEAEGFWETDAAPPPLAQLDGVEGTHNLRASLCIEAALEPEAAHARARSLSMVLLEAGAPVHRWSLDDEAVHALRRSGRVCMDLPLRRFETGAPERALYLVSEAGADAPDSADAASRTDAPDSADAASRTDAPDSADAPDAADSADAAPLTASAVRVELIVAAPLSLIERGLCALLLAAMLLRVLAWYARPGRVAEDAATEDAAPHRAPSPASALRWGRGHPIVGILALVGLLMLSSLIPSLGEAGVDLLMRSLVMLGVHVGVAWAMARWATGAPARALAQTRPRRGRPRVALAMTGGLILAVGASVVLALAAPPRESSVMQEITRLPSTTLAIAAMACLSPWHEEVFYRGYIQGAVEASAGVVASVAVSLGLFTLIHVPQHLGYLVPLIPILLVACVASGLRAWSGSSAPSFALHLGYNGLLVLPLLLGVEG